MMLWRVINDTVTETATQLTRELLDDPAIRTQLKAAVERELRSHLDLATKVGGSSDRAETDLAATADAAIADIDRRAAIRKLDRDLYEMQATNRRVLGHSFGRYLVAQIVMFGLMLAFLALMLPIGWLVTRATDNTWIGLAALMVVLVPTLAFLMWAANATASGMRFTHWLTRTTFPRR